MTLLMLENYVINDEVYLPFKQSQWVTQTGEQEDRKEISRLSALNKKLTKLLPSAKS